MSREAHVRICEGYSAYRAEWYPYRDRIDFSWTCSHKGY
jgi:hypothetical protein